MSTDLQILNSDSSLQLLPEGITPEMIATVDEAKALEPIPHRAKILKANGQKGAFVDTEGQQHGSTIEGLILAVLYSQAWFPPKNQNDAHYQSEQSWHWPKDRPICSSRDLREAPRVNTSLTAAQVEEVARRGAGVNCLNCPCRKPIPRPGKNLPPFCDESRVLLFLPRGGTEPFLLRANGFHSIRAINNYLADKFRFGQIVLKTYSFWSAFGFESTSNNKGDFYKLACVRKEAVETEHYEALATLASQYLREVEHVEEVLADAHGTGDEPGPVQSGRHDSAPPDDYVPPSDADAPGWDDIPF